MTEFSVAEVERWLDRLFVAAEGASLRREDRRKAVEVAAMLAEVERALNRVSRRETALIVDAAAGKSYVGLLAAKLVLEKTHRSGRVLTIESDDGRAESSRRAAERLECAVPIECRTADVADAASWPDRPAVVAALHACGPAADAIIENSVRCRTQVLLLVPCCTGKTMTATARAEEAAVRLDIPRQAPVRRRFIQAWVDAERTRTLESAGYETEVVEFVGPTITPHNLLWRARRVCPRRTPAMEPV